MKRGRTARPTNEDESPNMAEYPGLKEAIAELLGTPQSLSITCPHCGESLQIELRSLTTAEVKEGDPPSMRLVPPA